MSMEHPASEVTDAEFDEQILAFFRFHSRALVKAPMIGFMAGFSALIVSEALLKAAIVGIVCMLLATLHTWRRFLEPLAFWAFLAATIYWCDPEIITHLKTAARSLH